jgi:hypothetical protein
MHVAAKLTISRGYRSNKNTFCLYKSFVRRETGLERRTSAIIYTDDQIEDDPRERPCSTHGTEVRKKLWYENLKGAIKRTYALI